MGAMSSIKMELFDELEMSSTEKEILELTKLSDDDLYRMIGTAARKTSSSLKPSRDYLDSPNIGDATGKSAFFFKNAKVTSISPAVYFDLPKDLLEAGKLVYGQIGGPLDKVVCETVNNSPYNGYKQEALRLAANCAEAVFSRFPTVDRGIVNSFVAMRAKQQFNICNMW